MAEQTDEAIAAAEARLAAIQALNAAEARLAQIRALKAEEGTTRAEPSSWLRTGASFLPTAGEAVGTAVGSRYGGRIGGAAGGTLGAVAGKAAEVGLTERRLPTMQELGTEAAWTAGPQAAVAGVSKWIAPAARFLAKGTKGGLMLRKEEAARLAQEGVQQVFEPIARPLVDNMFALVRASGVKIDAAPVKAFVQSVGAGKTEALLADIAHLDTLHRTGGRYTALMQGILGKPHQILGVDIGELQHLRSDVRRLTESVESAEGRDLLHRFQVTIDQAIDTGNTIGPVAAGDTPQILREARRQYARLRASEDFGQLITKHLHYNDNLKRELLNPRTLADELLHNTSTLAKTVNRAVDQTPGGAQRLQELLKTLGAQFSEIEMGMSDTSGFRRMPFVAGIGQVVSDILLSETGRQWFTNIIVKKPGHAQVAVLPAQAVAVILNMIRRETLPTGAAAGYPAVTQVDASRARPGQLPQAQTGQPQPLPTLQSAPGTPQ